MAYLPKKFVKNHIKARVRRTKYGDAHTDYEAYFGMDPFDKKPIRITRASMPELTAAINDFYLRHKIGGDAAVRLTPMQAIDAKYAYDSLAAAGLKMSLNEAVNLYIDELSTRVEEQENAMKVIDAWEEYYDTKPDGADKHKANATSGKWARSLGDRTLVSLTAKEILDYLATNYDGRKPKTYNSHLLYIKTFLNWCCKDEREYLVKNPIRSVKFKPEPWEEPEYMKPEDVKRLFDLLWSNRESRPDCLAYAIVSFFCGCRGVEIVRMAGDPDAAKIDISEATARIAKAKGYQQGKRPRAFNIHPTALAWMQAFDFAAALQRVSDTTQKDMYDFARVAGIPVFQNCGRHTFITYHVAAYGDPAKTTAMVGTSEKMRAENYCGLASKADGEAYFKILPLASA